jgi:hypothetical protein
MKPETIYKHNIKKRVKKIEHRLEISHKLPTCLIKKDMLLYTLKSYASIEKETNKLADEILKSIV